MASTIGGHDGLAEGLATARDTATDEWMLAGTAALAALNWMAAPASAPNVIPPPIAATFVIFIAARTTCVPHELVRKQPIRGLCITNWARTPFQGSWLARATTFSTGAK